VTARRISRFVAVGAAGFVVQMTVAAALLQAGLRPVVATVLAIEAAIVSNHAWHRRWAWRDRPPRDRWPRTLLRAHLGAGATSLVVGAGTVAALSGHVSPLAAQVVAVGVCAVANYWITDRWIFRGASAEQPSDARSLRSAPGSSRRAPLFRRLEGRRPAVALLTLCAWLVAPGTLRADGPSRSALQSWDRYAAALERARDADVANGAPGWATDDDPRGVRVRAALVRGELEVTRRSIADIDVDGATLEHWQGSILVRGVTLPQMAQRLRHPEQFPQPRDVLALKVHGWSEDGHDLYLRLARSMVITATYDTWHRVRHRARGPARLDSTSVATRIEEIHDPGTASERRVRLEDSRDFLWRMQSSWRFTAVPEGVIVTCESIALSRPVPLGLGLVSRPIITRVARESMTTAVRAWQTGWLTVRGRSPDLPTPPPGQLRR
jgi:putative flippase GtrA